METAQNFIQITVTRRGHIETIIGLRADGTVWRKVIGLLQDSMWIQI